MLIILTAEGAFFIGPAKVDDIITKDCIILKINKNNKQSLATSFLKKERKQQVVLIGS